jgi:hypothetical protein
MDTREKLALARARCRNRPRLRLPLQKCKTVEPSGADKDRLAFFSLGLDAFCQVGRVLGAKDVALQGVLVQRATGNAVEISLHALNGQGRHARQMSAEPIEPTPESWRFDSFLDTMPDLLARFKMVSQCAY